MWERNVVQYFGIHKFYMITFCLEPHVPVAA